MNDRERIELAADIARRVRLYSWQPLPPELAAELGEYSWQWRCALPANGMQVPCIQMYWTPRPQRLTLEFLRYNGESCGRLLWTPETNP